MKYHQLSKAAKERARQWWIELEAEMWGQDRAPDLYEDMATCLKFLGITVSMRTEKWTHIRGGGVYWRVEDKPPTNHSREEYDFEWSGFWSQGDGLVFQGKWDATDVDLAGLVEYAPKDTRLHGIGQQMTAIMLACPTAHVKITTVNYGPGLPGMHVDEAYVDSEDEIPMPDEHGQAVSEQIAAAAHWCYRQLETNYEYDTGDEAAVDGIEANEYDFDEDGTMIPALRARTPRSANTLSTT